jgi:hypothetical protein
MKAVNLGYPAKLFARRADTKEHHACQSPDRLCVMLVESAGFEPPAIRLPDCGNKDELVRLHVCWWRGLDSNQRTLARADLQSAAFNHSATSPRGEARQMAGRSVCVNASDG